MMPPKSGETTQLAAMVPMVDRPQHIFRPIDDLWVRNLGELYDLLEPGQLLQEGGIPEGVREE